jgi:hypothetical protein
MKQTIDEEVSVVMYYSASLKQAVPYIMHWQNKDYKLSAVDYYHNYMQGRDRQHIYELVDKEETLWFRLRLDSSNLHWTLEAIHDGLAD